jgi:hypothetical protein
VYVLGGGGVVLQNSLLALNGPENCGVLAPSSQGHNLEDGTSCGFAATGDISETAALIEPLMGSAGTFVHRLQLASPAIDAGLCLTWPSVDQLGRTRPAGAGCDIGAYERDVTGKTYLPIVWQGG